MVKVFPKRNLGPGEVWGRFVEQALSRVTPRVDQVTASVAQLSRQVHRLLSQYPWLRSNTSERAVYYEQSFSTVNLPYLDSADVLSLTFEGSGDLLLSYHAAAQGSTSGGSLRYSVAVHELPMDEAVAPRTGFGFEAPTNSPGEAYSFSGVLQYPAPALGPGDVQVPRKFQASLRALTDGGTASVVWAGLGLDVSFFPGAVE